MTRILGFSAWFHDSSACLIADGDVVAFAEEERFSRRKHTPEYPQKSIEYCLNAGGGITLDDLDAVVYYINPATLIRGNLKYIAKFFPRSLNLFRRNTTVVPVRERYSNLLTIKSILCERHGARGNFKLVTVPHYLTHQGAAFLCSPFDDSAIITMDVAVDGTTQTIARGIGNRIETLLSHNLPHGWGMLYSLFTQYVGFKYYDEYKVMGMAAYGEPRYVDFIEDKLYRLDDDGAFQLNLDYFAFQHYGMRKIWSDRLIKELGPPRQPERPLEQRDYDMAASAQSATERFGLRMARIARRLTDSANLCIAGGVAQNVLMNQKIAEAGLFTQVFPQPLASDVGCSLGGALYYYNCILKKPRSFVMKHLYWGPEYRSDYETVLNKNGLAFKRVENPAPEIAKAVADGEVVGFFCSRMEAGPRALGGRSILADPRRAEMKDILNLRVKHREHFRPFAPSCLEEHVSEVFNTSPACVSYDYMITTAGVRPEIRSRVPAITHNDGTSRPQAVSKKTNPLYWEVIHEFYKLTGVPLVVNTSFNDNEPIVCTPQDAIDCFRRTHIDLLAFEDYLIYQRDIRN